MSPAHSDSILAAADYVSDTVGVLCVLDLGCRKYSGFASKDFSFKFYELVQLCLGTSYYPGTKSLSGPVPTNATNASLREDADLFGNATKRSGKIFIDDIKSESTYCNFEI